MYNSVRTHDDYDRLRLWLATTPDGRRIVEGKQEDFPISLFNGELERGLSELGFDIANVLTLKELALGWHRGNSQRGRLSRIDLALLRVIEHQLSMSLVSPPLGVRLQKLGEEIRRNSRRRTSQRAQSMEGLGYVVIGPGHYSD